MTEMVTTTGINIRLKISPDLTEEKRNALVASFEHVVETAVNNLIDDLMEDVKVEDPDNEVFDENEVDDELEHYIAVTHEWSIG